VHEALPETALTPVSTVVSRLESLQDLPVAEHAEVFDEVHRSLQDALATLDEA
jgi:hypothetical protein